MACQIFSSGIHLGMYENMSHVCVPVICTCVNVNHLFVFTAWFAINGDFNEWSQEITEWGWIEKHSV